MHGEEGISMIDKVSGQKYYEYTKVSQQKRGPVDASAFNETLEKQGVVYEPGSQKKAEKAKEPAKDSGTDGQKQAEEGVTLEISRRGYERSEQEKQRSGLIEGIRRFALRAVDFLKSVWDRVWNEPEQAEPEAFPEVLEEKIEEREDVAADVREDDGFSVQGAPGGEGQGSQLSLAEIRRLLRYGSQEEIEDFLSDHGKKVPARNTELLTQYDRSGALVDISNTERELILHGDKKEIRL